MYNNGCPEVEHNELESKLGAAHARIKELRMALAGASGATHSHHGPETDNVKDCLMASCQKASAVLAKNDYA